MAALQHAAALVILVLVATGGTGLQLVNGADFLPVACVRSSSVTINGIQGQRWCCSFKNTNSRIPVHNYQFVTSAFDPIRLDVDITPRGVVDAYVAPGRTFTFCFVNRASAGVPVFSSPTDPFVESRVITSPPENANFIYSCQSLPKYFKCGRITVAEFSCSISNNLSIPIAAVQFDCDGAEVLETNNMNPDCTLASNLAPRGTTGSKLNFSFKVRRLDLITSMTIKAWTILASPTQRQNVVSSLLNYSGSGWGGWSCPGGTRIVSAATNLTSPQSVTLWRPGAQVSGVAYPSTPFGYTYTPPEEGAIVRNGGTGQSAVINLVCTLPV